MHEDCEAVRRHISAGLDGELSEFEHAVVAEHVAACASCSVFARAVGATTAELRRQPLEPYERPIAVRRNRHRAWARFAPAVAALAVIGAGLGSLLSTASLQLPLGAGATEPAGGRAPSLAVNRLILADRKQSVVRSRIRAMSTAPQRAGGEVLPSAAGQQ